MKFNLTKFGDTLWHLSLAAYFLHFTEAREQQRNELNNGQTIGYWRSYIVSDDKRSGKLIVHAGMFHCHESRVDNNTERYEEVDEGIHNEQLNDMGKLVPARTAFPAEQQVHALGLYVLLQHPFLTEYP